jgi:hypothetical protein
MRRFPFAFDVDGGGVIVSHSTHKDDYLQAGTAETQRLGRPAEKAPDFYLGGVAKLADGRLYGASYATYAAGPGYDQIHGWVSDNGGASWSPRNGTLQLQEPRFERPAGWGALLLHRRMHRVSGALVATAYGGGRLRVHGPRDQRIRVRGRFVLGRHQRSRHSARRVAVGALRAAVRGSRWTRITTSC